jgi:hypothetical protein
MEWLRTPGMIYWRRNLEAFVHAVNDDGALPVLVVQTTLAKADNNEELRSRLAYRWVQLDHAKLVGGERRHGRRDASGGGSDWDPAY